MLPFVPGLLQVGTALLRYQKQVGGGQWPGWWPPRDEGKGGWAGTEVSFGLDLRPLPFIVRGSLPVLVSLPWRAHLVKASQLGRNQDLTTVRGLRGRGKPAQLPI